MNKIHRTLTIAGLTVVAGLTLAAPASASSQPVWAATGFNPGQEMEMRMLLGNVNRQFQPQIVATAAEVCSVLRAGGTSADAVDVTEAAGYFPGYSAEFAAGIMVDVSCPEQLGKLR